MTISKAKKILNDAGIIWFNYFDLVRIEAKYQNSKILIEAIEIIKKSITAGK